MICVSGRFGTRRDGQGATTARLWLALSVAAIVGPGTASAQPQATAPPPGSADSVVFVGAGDIAKCDSLGGAVGTARLLDRIPGTVFTVGDHAYDRGSAEDFAECYQPTWGRHKARTRPAPGNHDYGTRNAQGYFNYFGENAGPPGLGYYSFDLGAWHIISLNSTVAADRRSAQHKWLEADLAANRVDCILAYWHIPVFSSGSHGNDWRMREVWRLLYDHGADIVLNGHDHNYERFAPQDPNGKADPVKGIRAFVVGTGGGGVYRQGRRQPNSEVWDNSSYGVLKLTLSPGAYAWAFVPMPGMKLTDSGTGTCSPVF